MRTREPGVEGALEITPVRHGGSRGAFPEWFRGDRPAGGREPRTARTPTDGACVAYPCPETYAPDRERSVRPLGLEPGIARPVPGPLLSARAACAPGPARAYAGGIPPGYEACRCRTSGESGP
ncbi:hypothetical protein ACFXAE_10480 [Streptomyces sp. NPDC059454]|uniref:hypothetical protein n=1 Tax=Streptomyces sp. NPDC059454 TaxID=3346836 RepID=UPI003685018C